MNLRHSTDKTFVNVSSICVHSNGLLLCRRAAGGQSTLTRRCRGVNEIISCEVRD